MKNQVQELERIHSNELREQKEQYDQKIHKLDDQMKQLSLEIEKLKKGKK